MNINKDRKGILLCGGHATRLRPLTNIESLSKQILPIYNKPMVYYSMSILMEAGIKEILIISTPEHIDFYKNIFGSGEYLGLKIDYLVQLDPAGIAQAYVLAEDFLNDSPSCLVLGDNLMYGEYLAQLLKEANRDNLNHIFAKPVADPERFGVVEIDKNNIALNIEEKPKKPKSNLAVPGIYFFDARAPEIAKKYKPSERGELEITDVIGHYMKEKKLKVKVLKEGTLWLDCGTFDSLLNASNLVKTVEKSNASIVACLEEIALNNNFISKNDIKLSPNYKLSNSYGEYLRKIINEA